MLTLIRSSLVYCKKLKHNRSNKNVFLCFRFNVILVSRSYAQLRATFQEYAKIANKDIDDTIQSEMSGDLKDSMLAIGRFLNPDISNKT